MAAGPVLAQTGPGVKSLSFSGVSLLSTNDLRGRFTTSTSEPLDLSVLQRDIEAMLVVYGKEGYVFCSAQPVLKYASDSSWVDVTVEVREGKRVVVGTVRVLEGVDHVSAVAGLESGQTFHPLLVEEFIRRILKSSEREGYPFASARVEQISFHPGPEVDSAQIDIVLEQGEKTEVSEVQVEGNARTRESVIVREVRLRSNTVFTDAWALTVKRRLERMGLFDAVSIPEFYSTKQGAGGVLLRVKEGNQNRFDGILGYVPAAGKEKGYATGLVDLQFGNLFGTARSLSTRWTRENRSTQDLALRYREPWIASIPLNATGVFRQRKQDSTYVRRSYGLDAQYQLADDFSIGLSAEQTSVFPSPRAANPVSGSETSTLGVSMRYDTRDHPANPTDGVLYAAAYELGKKSASKKGAEELRKWQFDLESYIPVVERQILALSLHGRDVRLSSLEQGDLFHIGGTATLRGYRESQFLCSRVVWSNAEYRFLSGERSRLFGFIDAAYISLDDRPIAGLVGAESFKVGYGVGAHVDSGVGTIGFSVGVGEGDTFRTAKLHFLLINEF